MGKIFSVVSEDSALNTCIPPTWSTGKILKAITIIPTPPNHCNKALQIKMPSDLLLIFWITEEPVVVTPDIDSKNESVKFIFESDKKNGIQPNNAIRIQEEDVSRKASCIMRRCLFPPLVERKRAIPKEIEIKELIRNESQEEFW